LPGLCSPRGRLLSLHEYSGALLHRLLGRYRRAGLGRADGFRSLFEAYIGGEWYAFDARNNVPRIGRVLIARGRDAADVAITTTFGPNTLASFRVWTEEIAPVG
jgi:transglutaminase-like putative cysteine protease